jgi:hypothetical protein
VLSAPTEVKQLRKSGLAGRVGYGNQNRRDGRCVEAAHRIEKLCQLHTDGELESLVSGDEAATALLARILASVQTGVPDPEALGLDLDELERFAARCGIDGLTTAVRAYKPPPDPGSGNSVAHVSLCPNRCCSRAEIEYGAPSRVGDCAILGQPLDRVRLEL